MQPLTPAERADLTAKLTEARQAYHNLVTGNGVAQSRDQNGETITYSVTKLPELSSYIASLEMRLGLTSSRAIRPARVIFGRI